MTQGSQSLALGLPLNAASQLSQPCFAALWWTPPWFRRTDRPGLNWPLPGVLSKQDLTVPHPSLPHDPFGVC